MARYDARTYPRTPLALTFDPTEDQLGEPIRSVPNAGMAALRVEVVGDGSAYYAEGPNSGVALRLPRLTSPTSTAPAILRVSNATPTDALDPGTSPLQFGAVVKLFPESVGGWRDNGDNLLQRGLYDDPVQYKIDLDGRRPTCRVKGSEGVVEVSGAPIRPDTWYQITCTRRGPQVSLLMRPLGGEPGAQAEPVVFWAVGRIGSVHFAEPGVPLSIGGKVGSDGSPEVASDQLNGLIGRVFVRFGPAR